MTGQQFERTDEPVPQGPRGRRVPADEGRVLRGPF
jgi:hypothetical protein